MSPELTQIFQIIPLLKEEKVLLYISDGTVRIYDYSRLKAKFKFLRDQEQVRKMVVINGTLAWDLTGHRNSEEVIDLSPEMLYEESEVVSEEDYYFRNDVINGEKRVSLA